MFSTLFEAYGHVHKIDCWYESRSHLKNLEAHVRNSQVNFGAFPVSCWVEANAVHFQFTGNLQDLEI